MRRPRAAVPAPALVLGGVVGLEGGAVVAATVIPLAGIVGTVMLRVGFGAIGLLVLGRPSLRGLDRRSVLLVKPAPRCFARAYSSQAFGSTTNLPSGCN